VIKEVLSTFIRHPSLIVYSLSNPDLSSLKNRIKELRKRDRQRELTEIKLQAIGKKEKIFTFNGKIYEYFYHDYNATWAGERTVEIPIIWEMVKEQRSRGAKILEVGNVLSHYFNSNHTVVDKFERWPGVINEDILSFNPEEKFDLIVSISTLEHIGWSLKRGVEDPEGFSKAVAKLRMLLNEGGQIWFTVPIGYNPYVDEVLRRGALNDAEMFFMKRTSYDNKWLQCDFSQVADYPYGGFKIRKRKRFPFPKANAIAIVRMYSKNNLKVPISS